jgi:hypothetical protein
MKTFIIFLFTSLAWIVWFNITPYRNVQPVITNVPPAITYTQDPTLLGVLASVGATDISKLNIFYKELDNQDYRGFYSGNTIQIKPGLDTEQEKRTVSHEYLHYIWYKVLTFDKTTELSSKVIELYIHDIDMQKRVSAYTDRNMLNTSELFSIYCTESSDSYSNILTDDCNKYINRWSLTLTR